MSTNNSDWNSGANSPRSREGAEENTASKRPTISRRNVLLGTTAMGAAAALPGSPSGFVSTAAAQSATPEATSTNPLIAKKGFKGVIKLDARDSTPDWGPFTAARAPEGSPNILIIL
jgi:hypothetical protein